MQNKAEPFARLMLVTPPVDEAATFADVLSAVCTAGDVAAVIVRFSPEADVEASARVLMPRVQERNAAFLLEDHPRLALQIGADGAHFSDAKALRDMVAALKPGHIVGVGGLATRHDAMLAGEAGADYVLFGEPDAAGRRPQPGAIGERVAWWAAIFEIPCVAYAVSLDEVSAFAKAGADFVALDAALWAAPERAQTAVADALARLPEPERART